MNASSRLLMERWDFAGKYVNDNARTCSLVGIIQGLDQRYLRDVLAGIIQVIQDSGDLVQFKRLTREMEEFAGYAIKEKERADTFKEIESALNRLEQNAGIGDHKPTTPLKKNEGILSDEYLSFLRKEGKVRPSVIRFPHKNVVHAADQPA